MQLRRKLHANPEGVFLHDAVLQACERFASQTAFVDTSCQDIRRISYAEYGDTVERLARGLVGAGVRPGEVIGIYLPNSWEFAAAFHAATLAGAIPTPLNPSYREREVRFQLENSEAALLVTDGALIREMNLSGLPRLRRVYCTREQCGAAEPFTLLLAGGSSPLPRPEHSAEEIIAALPYSSGTTGMPKGVMLSHANLITNVYQFLSPDEDCTPRTGEVVLCVLPLYHIYGLNVVMNPFLMIGATVVLVPRFDQERVLRLITEEHVNMLPLVPPLLNIFCQAAEQGRFPRDHEVRWVKSGAAPLAPELPRRFTALTGIPVRQGYGMTEASPVTHMGYIEPDRYRPESVGPPVALTDCKLLALSGAEAAAGESGELVMRGPQFMLGYWKAPNATADVLRDGWYRSGDIARTDQDGFFYILDRRKELIKYKGFPVAPAEVESVLLEHPAVRDCGVVGRDDKDAGEIPCAVVVLNNGFTDSEKLKDELTAWVAERLSGYKQPRQMQFVSAIPRTASGKVLRRELRKAFE